MTQDEQTLWLNEVLPDVVPDYENYYACERDVIGPALRAAGYRLIGGWYCGERDSWGPLSRCIQTDKGVVVYG